MWRRLYSVCRPPKCPQLAAQMRSAAMSAIPPLSGKRTLRSHLAGSINSVACRADRRATVVRWRCRGSFRPRLTRQGPKEPRGLVLLFGRPEANPFQPNAHTTLPAPCGPHAIPAYIPDPPGLRSAGFFRLRHSIGQKRACYGLSAPRQWGRLFGLMCDRQLQYSRALAA